jgi:four helix bundle protein
MVDGQGRGTGTSCASTRGMKAKKLEDVVVYRESCDAADEISAMLERPIFGKDYDLKGQLSRSTGRIAPLIAEGFGQLTDRHLATYLARARGSALETKGHLRKARGKNFITEIEYADFCGKYNIIGKRLTRWINYLEGTNWTDRG